MVPPKHRRPVRRKPCRWSIAGGVLVFFAPVLVLAFGTEDPGGIVFYDAGMQQFCWTASVVYPFVYRFSDGVWLFYELGSSNPRWFYNFTTQQ